VVGAAVYGYSSAQWQAYQAIRRSALVLFGVNQSKRVLSSQEASA
jgi:hypothetical protein